MADPNPTERRARDLDLKLGSWVVALLTLIGLWLLISPLWPRVTGYAYVVDLLGSETAVNRFFVAFLFLYFAGMVKEKNFLRHTLTGLMQIIRDHLPATRVQRSAPAVETLLRVLRTDRPEAVEKARQALSQLAGKDLGPDPAAWERWWEEQRAKDGSA